MMEIADYPHIHLYGVERAIMAEHSTNVSHPFLRLDANILATEINELSG